MSLIALQSNRGKTVDIVIKDVNGDAIVPQTNDQIRFVIGRAGEIGNSLAGAKLVVTGTATANGSVFTKNSPTSGTNRLRLDASDLTFEPGVYTGFVEYYDNADAQEWKTVDRQCVSLERT